MKDRRDHHATRMGLRGRFMNGDRSPSTPGTEYGVDCLTCAIFAGHQFGAKQGPGSPNRRNQIILGSQFEDNYFTEMCSGSEAGSYLRLIDFVYHSTLVLRVIEKRSSYWERVGHPPALSGRPNCLFPVLCCTGVPRS